MLTKEITTPLKGKPIYKSTGIIQVYDNKKRFFNVGEVTNERFDEQNFQYVFKPYWKAVDALPEGLFRGIPGIDMDKRQEEYYRVNITPTFISMRTPSESREDLWELLSSVGLDYYDRFEWLLRTEDTCSDDNLFVIRKPTVKEHRINLARAYMEYFSPENEIEIESLSSFGGSKAKLIDELFQLLQSGGNIYIRDEERYIEESERESMLYLLKNMIQAADRMTIDARREGINLAKGKGVYRGRKPIDVDKKLLRQVAKDFRSKKISEAEAMKLLGLKSRSTFYRKLNLVK